MMTDPIADFLTRLRNGIGARKETIDVPANKLKVRLCELLREEDRRLLPSRWCGDDDRLPTRRDYCECQHGRDAGGKQIEA